MLPKRDTHTHTYTHTHTHTHTYTHTHTHAHAQTNKNKVTLHSFSCFCSYVFKFRELIKPFSQGIFLRCHSLLCQSFCVFMFSGLPATPSFSHNFWIDSVTHDANIGLIRKPQYVVHQHMWRKTEFRSKAASTLVATNLVCQWLHQAEQMVLWTNIKSAVYF